MNNLIKPMETVVMMFAATKYFSNNEELTGVMDDIEEKISAKYKAKFIRVIDDYDYKSDIEGLEDRPVIMIPMSGSVQPGMLEAAEKFKAISICPGYNDLVVSEKGKLLMLKNNTAPAAMDVYAVLRRSNKIVEFFTDFESFDRLYNSARAVYRLKGSRVLLIGKTESWVISSTRNLDTIASKVGIEVINKPLDDLKKVYDETSSEEASELYSNYIENNTEVVEPDDEALMNSFRLTKAIVKMMESYDCDGFAIACFDLLGKFNTTSCMALSYLNDSHDHIGTCEGDLDSSVTLMLMKALTGKPGFMANPVVLPGDTIELSHCSAPLCMTGNKNDYTIRNHHESGIGVSPQVNLQDGETVTLVRVGNEISEMNVLPGETLKGERLPVCRTQISVHVDDIRDYLDNSLGCHLVMTYGDYRKELEYIGKLTGLKVTP